MLRFFREHGEDYRRAMRVCSSCLVRAQRPAFALERRTEDGRWGGAGWRGGAGCASSGLVVGRASEAARVTRV